MKRLLLILLACIVPIFLHSCQKELDLELDIDIFMDDGEVVEDIRFDFEEIMPLSNNSPGPQGGDCWGDYFFQFVNWNSIVRVYDLATKSMVQTITIPGNQRGFVSQCHCNTACFGTEYYDDEDLFPLIYVSTGYAADGYTGALVYRITQNKGVFSVSLVQTLRFPVDKTSWTEFVPAGEYAYLCYTSERVIFKVPMPKLKDGDVIIDRNSAIETFQFTPQPDWMYSSRNQDRLFYQGKIVYISGVPLAGEASVFVILNLEKRKREAIVDFKEYGLESEPESIFLWRGDLCVAFVDRIVKLILN